MNIDNQNKTEKTKELIEGSTKSGASADSGEVKKRYQRKHPIMQQGQSYYIEPKNQILFSKTRD
jgi:hypothetical protein